MAAPPQLRLHASSPGTPIRAPVQMPWHTATEAPGNQGSDSADRLEGGQAGYTSPSRELG